MTASVYSRRIGASRLLQRQPKSTISYLAQGKGIFRILLPRAASTLAGARVELPWARQSAAPLGLVVRTSVSRYRIGSIAPSEAKNLSENPESNISRWALAPVVGVGTAANADRLMGFLIGSKPDSLYRTAADAICRLERVAQAYVVRDR